MHYYKRNLGDYAKKAGRLSMLQHGSYTLLIDACYDREQFPTHDEAIEWTWASSSTEIEAVEFVLRKFFTLEGGVYVQKRIQEEIAEYHNKATTNSRIATERETKRREKSTNRARTVHDASPQEHEPPPNHKPITNNHKPITKERERSAAKRRQQIPDAFYPDETGLDKAREKGLSVAVQLTKFVDYHVGKGSVMSDWQAAWRTWIGNARPETPNGKPAETAYQRSQREKYEQIAPAVAARAPNNPNTFFNVATLEIANA